MISNTIMEPVTELSNIRLQTIIGILDNLTRNGNIDCCISSSNPYQARDLNSETYRISITKLDTTNM